MSNFEEIFSKLILKKEKSIKAICKPLVECLDIPYVMFARIYANGECVNLANCCPQLAPYYNHKMYLLDPYVANPLLFRSGTIFVPDAFNPEYMQTIFRESQIGNVLIISFRSEQYFDRFFYSTKVGQSADVLFNHMDLLHNFSKYFLREAQDLIEKAFRENFNVKEVVDTFHSNNPETPLSITNPQIRRFLSHILPLTPREIQCLELFKQGKTAQMTGAILGLSQRTVEYYFDNIKNKLGCSSKTDLLTW